MNMMKKKLGKTGGFTLVEMLIVVAIIAILIAVSIPLVSQALEKARDATDQANERAAKAEAVMVYMGVTTVEFKVDTGASYGTYVYDAVKGELLNQTTFSGTGYGKCTQIHTSTGATGGTATGGFAAVKAQATGDTEAQTAGTDEGNHVKTDGTGGYLKVRIFKDGSVDMAWVTT